MSYIITFSKSIVINEIHQAFWCEKIHIYKKDIKNPSSVFNFFCRVDSRFLSRHTLFRPIGHLPDIRKSWNDMWRKTTQGSSFRNVFTKNKQKFSECRTSHYTKQRLGKTAPLVPTHHRHEDMNKIPLPTTIYFQTEYICHEKNLCFEKWRKPTFQETQGKKRGYNEINPQPSK